jgi:hypothetical protein
MITRRSIDATVPDPAGMCRMTVRLECAVRPWERRGACGGYGPLGPRTHELMIPMRVDSSHGQMYYVCLYQRGPMDCASGASVRHACVCVAVGPGKCLPAFSRNSKHVLQGWKVANHVATRRRMAVQSHLKEPPYRAGPHTLAGGRDTWALYSAVRRAMIRT